MVMFVVAIVLAILAPFFTALVQMAVSRQREYLADASSVELTRNPHGLERALAKISADPDPFDAANGATQHLFIVNPLKKLGGGGALFSTHPPIVDRVNRLRQLTGDAAARRGPGRGSWPVSSRRAGVLRVARRRSARSAGRLPCSVSLRRGTFPRADGLPVRLTGPR